MQQRTWQSQRWSTPNHPPQTVTDRATGDEFFNNSILQRRPRAIDMIFYWVRDKVIQGQFLLYWMDGEHNLADYFTEHHPASHHWSQRSTYIVPTSGVSKYAYYMSTIDMWGCVESLHIWVNGKGTDKLSLLYGKETNYGQTDTNRPESKHGIGGYNIGLIGIH